MSWQAPNSVFSVAKDPHCAAIIITPLLDDSFAPLRETQGLMCFPEQEKLRSRFSVAKDPRDAATIITLLSEDPSLRSGKPQKKMRTAYIYIMGNKRGVLYVGMTNDIQRRVDEHKRRTFPGFSRKYKTDRLLFYEQFNHPLDALESERIIKGWIRKKKLDLIRTLNPMFKDLSERLVGVIPSP